MSDQFSVHRNPGRSVKVIPFVVVIQCNRFSNASQRVVVPLVSAEAFGLADSDIASHFVINDHEVVFAPRQITNVPARVLGPVVASLADDDEQIIRALDAFLSRARR